MEALRDNGGKAELSQLLLFKRALIELARHTTQGRLKYPDAADGTPNWALGGKPDGEYLDAALRHITEVVCGNEIDPESGTEHLSAAIWNLLALQTLNRPSNTDTKGSAQ